MSDEVLRGARPTVGARTLTLPDGQTMDPTTEARVTAAREEGYAQGHRDGRRDGERAASARLDGLARAVADALDGTRAELAALRGERASATVGLARRIAETVLAREPSQRVVDVLARVERALADLDDTDLTVAVSADEAEEVDAALSGTSGVRVVADGRLGVGEATVRGCHGAADLTREAVWAAVDSALDPPDEHAGEEGA